jgi:hypothetical protein
MKRLTFFFAFGLLVGLSLASSDLHHTASDLPPQHVLDNSIFTDNH